MEEVALRQLVPAIQEGPQGSTEVLNLLHRGGFRMRTHEVGSRQWNRSRSDVPRQAL